jgi:hypothetical protein
MLLKYSKRVREEAADEDAFDISHVVALVQQRFKEGSAVSEAFLHPKIIGASAQGEDSEKQFALTEDSEKQSCQQAKARLIQAIRHDLYLLCTENPNDFGINAEQDFWLLPVDFLKFIVASEALEVSKPYLELPGWSVQT